MNKTYLKLGDWNAICDVCGFKYKASELRKRWDNMRVCDKDWEERHPQDFLKVKPDHQKVPWARTEQADKYVTVNPLDPDDVIYSLPTTDVGEAENPDGSVMLNPDGSSVVNP
jgi:hypothetical protein